MSFSADKPAARAGENPFVLDKQPRCFFGEKVLLADVVQPNLPTTVVGIISQNFSAVNYFSLNCFCTNMVIFCIGLCAL
jgi:hypothetical protein